MVVGRRSGAQGGVAPGPWFLTKLRSLAGLQALTAASATHEACQNARPFHFTRYSRCSSAGRSNDDDEDDEDEDEDEDEEEEEDEEAADEEEEEEDSIAE